ncbi:MAG: EAL domain-containing protein [Tepidimonas taiwanensis]|uniref:sensor domain-containing protein n=1 Tax=Tepidimonas taiwanensis TaxID=307486 RepID=UPI0009DDB3E0|nr:EAL domain-containing protein [Tepidimonas taiwanensis]MCX7693757.1 EAL domain-containing protein [Tepidimonas taiwanensis]
MTTWLGIVGWILALVFGAGWWRAHRCHRRMRALFEAEQRWFAGLLDRLGIAYWCRNLDTQALWWSDGFRRMHGVAPDEPVSRDRALRHLVPEDRTRVNMVLETAYVQGTGETSYRIQQPDGRITHHILRIAVSREPASGQRVAYGISLDITDRVELENALRERTAYLEAIVAHLPMGLSVFDCDLKLRVWNAEFGRILELPSQLLTEGRDFDELIRLPAQRGEYGDVDVEEAVAQRRALALRFEPHRLERTRPNGRTHLVIGEPILHNGQVVGFVSTYTDITEQKQERERLERALDVLRTLLDNIPVGITMIDAELRLQVWNERLLHVLDLPRELLERPGVTLLDILRYNIERGEYGPSDDVDATLDAMRERVLRFEPHDFERTRPNGRVLHVRGQPLATGGYVTIYEDVTQQRTTQAEIEQQARTDALTGLLNRHALPAVLTQIIATAQREGRPVAVLFIDLDRFKAINDSLGHEVGDAVLVESARRLRTRLRNSDVVARIGGDEFVVVLTGITDAADAAHVATQLVEDLSQRIAAATGHHDAAPPLHVSPSIGIAVFPKDATRPSELLRLADIAMYHAKGEGGSGWRFYTPAMNEQVLHRIRLETRLRDAIAHDQLVLYYQPIHALTEDLPLIGFEALVRWPQPDGEILPPAAFMPVAEQSAELIEALGRWVCKTVARQRQRWRALHPGWPPLTISINLSAKQFDRAGVAERIRRAFVDAEGATEPSALPLLGIEFEITESVMMRDPISAEEELERLREMGAHIAIDDFGTGYSSLAYIKHLPIDRIKIDRAFVHDLAHDTDDAAIVCAAVEMGHRLGRSVVAEGVETAEQLQRLHAIGCDAVQGFALARPMPAHQVPSYVQRVSRGDHLQPWLFGPFASVGTSAAA